MTTPTKAEIIEEATRLYFEDCFKRGCQSPITPEIAELRESGFLSIAQSLLMQNHTRHTAEQWQDYAEQTEKPQVEKQGIPFDLAEAKDTGVFTCGTSQSGKTTLNKHIAQKLISQGIAVYVLDVSRAWMQEAPISNVTTVPHGGNSINVQPNRSTILDLSELSFEERFRFVNAFTAMLYQWHKSWGYKRAPYEFIFYEESQTYVANGCFRSYKKYAPLIDLITVGANFNLRFGLITQFPAMVDKAPVKISQQRYFGWTTEKNDLDYICKFIGKDWIPEIKALRKGEFLYQCRNEIVKFQCKKFANACEVKADSLTRSGHSYQYQYECAMVV
jgi:hypothetical protein